MDDLKCLKGTYVHFLLAPSILKVGVELVRVNVQAIIYLLCLYSHFS